MNDNETHKVRNTTLFLAELYIQLQNVSNFPSHLFFIRLQYCEIRWADFEPIGRKRNG